MSTLKKQVTAYNHKHWDSYKIIDDSDSKYKRGNLLVYAQGIDYSVYYSYSYVLVLGTLSGYSATVYLCKVSDADPPTMKSNHTITIAADLDNRSYILSLKHILEKL